MLVTVLSASIALNDTMYTARYAPQPFENKSILYTRVCVYYQYCFLYGVVIACNKDVTEQSVPGSYLTGTCVCIYTLYIWHVSYQ